MRGLSSTSLTLACLVCSVFIAPANAEEDTLSVRGVIQAEKQSDLSVSISARISALPLSVGQRFKRGEKLIRFDCSQKRAELDALLANKRALETKQATTAELFSYGAAGKSELDIAQAETDRAAAEARAKETQLNQCTVTAPFSGYVTERHVAAFETPAPGAALLSIIDDGPRQIKLIAPSKWLRWLSTGQELTFEVDETGASYTAEVIRIGRVVDAVSRTVEFTAEFTEATDAALPGMSGSAVFDLSSLESDS